jgi:hypothetical protein
MSNAPDYDRPGKQMSDLELATNIERLLGGWLESCDREELLELHTYLGGAKKSAVKHQCPGCLEYIYADECPEEAPDFLCEPCHLQRYYDDPDWREDTDKRRNA